MTIGERRDIICGDALEWFENQRDGSLEFVVGSIPDASELDMTDMDEYKHWFADTLTLLCSKINAKGYLIVLVTDRRSDGHIVSKSALAHEVANSFGMNALWHKIVPVAPIGTVVNLGRNIGYSHMLAFSKKGRPGRPTGDILEFTKRTWKRGFTTSACEQIVTFLKEVAPSATLISPFCGKGALLALAELHGVPSIGIEIDSSIAAEARRTKW